jgi:hypothetical protein
MENAEQLLVIILSSTLTVFLIVSIIAVVYIIKLVKIVQRISAKAEALTDKAEAVGEFMQHAAGPILMGKVVAGISDHFFSRKSKRK